MRGCVAYHDNQYHLTVSGPHQYYFIQIVDTQQYCVLFTDQMVIPASNAADTHEHLRVE
jgi:hypothetical protein